MSTKGQPLYKDLGKRANDLLTKEFPTENKLEWKSERTGTNTTLEANLTQKKDGSIVGTVTPKYKYKFSSFVGNFLAEVNTKKEVKGEVSVDNLVPNLKTTVTVQSKEDEVFGILAEEYRHEHATAAGSLEYGKVKGSTLKGSVVVGNQGATFGVNSEYFIGASEESSLKEFAGNIGYSTPDFDVNVIGKLDSRGEEDKTELGGSFYHRVNSEFAVGLEVAVDAFQAASNKAKLAFGSEYKVGGANDVIYKGRFDTTGKLQLSLAQRLNKNSKVLLSAAIDTNNLSGKAASTFGFVLSLND